MLKLRFMEGTGSEKPDDEEEKQRRLRVAVAKVRDSEDHGTVPKVVPEAEEELVLNPEEGRSVEELDHKAELDDLVGEIAAPDGANMVVVDEAASSVSQSRSGKMYQLLKAEIRKEQEARRKLEAQVEDLKRLSSEISSHLGNNLR